MNSLKIYLVVMGLLTIGSASSQAAVEKGYAVLETDEIQASDYVGVSMGIPERIQKLIGMTTAKAEGSREAKRIQIHGRIAQDVDAVVEVYAPESGTLTECPVSLGVRVDKDQIICRMTGASTKEVVEIRAPASGVIVADFARPGNTVSPVSPIHTIANFSQLPASFDVYEKDVGKVKLGQSVYAYASAYPDKTFEGEVVFISPRVDENTFTMKIRVLIENPDDLLKPGMFIRGEILLEDGAEHVAIPSFSIQNLDGIDVVFVQDEKESFIPTEVEVTYAGHEQTLVKGDVNPGDDIVVKGAYILKSKIMEDEIVGGCAHGH